jgi:glycosyltransferase involved in cell wall biosynthesis
MKISIVVVVLNGHALIRDCLESIITQGYKDLELVVVDGDSQDGTMEILRSYVPYISKLHSAKDGGLYFAMNNGIDLASGEVIGIIGCDDRLVSGALDAIAEVFAEDSELDVTYGEMEYIDRKKNSILRTEISDIPRVMIPHPATFAKRRLYDEFGKFNTNFRVASDYDLIFRLVQGNAKFKKLNRIIVNSYSNGFSAQRSNQLISIKESLHIRREYGSKIALLPWFLAIKEVLAVLIKGLFAKFRELFN